ncbi:MAG: NAD(P)-binding domain-containing protein [Candidatus Bathyarchaeia archaeon]|jgi:UDPglucose 6-dehydrogenase
MKLGVIGSGYVGKNLGRYFLWMGHNVLFYDTNPDVILSLEKNGYNVTNRLSDISKCDVSFICVPTPVDDRGNLILDSIIAVSQKLGEALKEPNNEHIVVVKSTILPRTTENVIIPMI